jgi:predicted RNA methylase
VTSLLLPGIDVLPAPQTRQRALSQWWTPPTLARRFAEWALDGLRFPSVVEPSAGDGALVRAILEARPLARIMAIEIDPQWVSVLRERHEHEIAAVVEDDYLRRAMHEVAAVVMNPPYENGLDGRFLAHAMTHADRIGALLRVNSLTGQERHAQVWSSVGKDWQLDGLAYMARRPQFSAAGIDVGHAQHDFCAVRLVRTTKRRKCEVQWWT